MRMCMENNVDLTRMLDLVNAEIKATANSYTYFSRFNNTRYLLTKHNYK